MRKDDFERAVSQADSPPSSLRVGEDEQALLTPRAGSPGPEVSRVNDHFIQMSLNDSVTGSNVSCLHCQVSISNSKASQGTHAFPQMNESVHAASSHGGAGTANAQRRYIAMDISLFQQVSAQNIQLLLEESRQNRRQLSELLDTLKVIADACAIIRLSGQQPS